MKVSFAKITCVLAATLAFVAPVVPVSAQTLTTTKLLDGTGTVGLPPGWKVVGSSRGSVDCSGPQGALIRLGVPWAVTLPIDPATGQPTIAAGQAPTANEGDLNTALNEVLVHNGAKLIKMSRRQAKSVTPTAPAYYICYDFSSAGKTYTAIGYCTTLSYGPTSPVWSFYCSAVIAPKPVFWKMLPTMLKIWASWRPNGQKPEAGSATALNDSIIKERWDSAEKNHLYFREAILGDVKK